MPVELLPYDLQEAPKGKTIFVVRNPKDNCVSLYHFFRMNMVFPHPGPWEQFFVDFCQGNIQLGSWFDHVHGYWQVVATIQLGKYMHACESYISVTLR